MHCNESECKLGCVRWDAHDMRMQDSWGSIDGRESISRSLSLSFVFLFLGGLLAGSALLCFAFWAFLSPDDPDVCSLICDVGEWRCELEACVQCIHSGQSATVLPGLVAKLKTVLPGVSQQSFLPCTCTPRYRYLVCLQVTASCDSTSLQ